MSCQLSSEATEKSNREVIGFRQACTRTGKVKQSMNGRESQGSQKIGKKLKARESLLVQVAP